MSHTRFWLPFGWFSRPVIERLAARRDTPKLIAALEHRWPRVRERAAGALGPLGDCAATPALLRALFDSDARVRAAVSDALVRLRDPAAIDALTVLATAEPWPRGYIHSQAAYTQRPARQQQASAGSALAPYDPTEYFVSLAAIDVLRQIGGRRAVEVLSKRAAHDGSTDELGSDTATRALLDLAEDVPARALVAIVRRGGRTAGRLAWERLATLIERGPEVLRLLEPGIGREPDIRVASALRFLDHGDLRGLAPLVTLLEHPPRDNDPNLSAHGAAKDTLLKRMAARPSDVPLPLLHRLASLPDKHEDVLYYLEDDPRYDAGHDTVHQDYAEVRAAARQALRERGIEGDRAD